MRLSVLFICLFVFCSQPCYAHRVNVFAWVEGSNVLVQAGFSKKNPAQHAKITVCDAKTKQVLTGGITDEKGGFSFPIQGLFVANGLLIFVDAGEGHTNSWTLEPQAFGLPRDTTNLTDTKENDTVSLADVRAAVKEEIAPLLHELALERAYKSPGWKDIVGGLGWIVGITALLYSILSRKSAIK